MDSMAFKIPANLSDGIEQQTGIPVQDIFGPNIADHKPVQLLPYHIQHYNDNVQCWTAKVAAAHLDLIRGFQCQIDAEAKLKEVAAAVERFDTNERGSSRHQIDCSGEYGEWWHPDRHLEKMAEYRKAITDKTPPTEWSDSAGLNLALFEKHAFLMSKHLEELRAIFTSFSAVPISMGLKDIDKSRRAPLYSRRTGNSTGETICIARQSNDGGVRKLELPPVKWRHAHVLQDYCPSTIQRTGVWTSIADAGHTYKMDIQKDDLNLPRSPMPSAMVKETKHNDGKSTQAGDEHDDGSEDGNDEDDNDNDNDNEKEAINHVALGGTQEFSIVSGMVMAMAWGFWSILQVPEH
ncbi:hypothetical protein F4604DRAFT_1676392 [Suillus subluteus]|nr:hypothetical protein F4604DRAFT_1676392 [Suillus subluteus]